ncbi:hypothetical protein [Sphingomonas sp. TDK1]|uniref:hypothetical protein n=1 Tax=Sphingomonas sp. TDK1 TaxID=453247 RepID=UPI0007D9C2AD|nr:hypothetical protein [Sphingomonas sp. TDK1]OAN59484.1 hypothetical protein A7X12_24580 [Sphingomonas sp. TDK1]
MQTPAVTVFLGLFLGFLATRFSFTFWVGVLLLSLAALIILLYLFVFVGGLFIKKPIRFLMSDKKPEDRGSRL